jgi:PhnB protein
MNIPKTHQAVMAYLMLDNAAPFITFTEKAFNASLINKTMKEDGTGIMHSEVSIGGCTIMFCDTAPQWPAATANLFVYVDNADEAYAKALAAGATSIMELSDQSYGRTCGVKDPTGNVWWITSV